MRSKIAVIALGIVVVASAFGASAFTTGSVDRASSINVQTDSAGLIGLEAGANQQFVNENSGELTIDVSNGSGAGVNQNATYQLGDQNEPAFNITNNFNSDQSFQAQYTLNTDDSSVDPNLQFNVYNSTGATVATVTEENTSATSLGTLTAGESYGVIIDIDTTSLNSGDDLSGSLNVSA